MKRLTDSKKVEMVLTSFQSKVVITKHCKKYGVSRSTFYRIKKVVMEALAILAFIGYRKNITGKYPQVKKSKKKYYRCRSK